MTCPWSPAPRESSMRVLLRPLRACPDLPRALRTDGWRLEGGPDEAILTEHPRVADEEAARSRLHRLGLLTSGAVRIEFLPAPWLSPRAPEAPPASAATG